VIYLGFACRCLIGLVFVLSVAGKVRGRRAFEEFVTATRELLAAIVPGPDRKAVRAVSLAVIAAEAVIPPLVLIPGLTRVGFAVAVALLAAFTVAIAAVLRRGSRTACHCFGTSASPLRPVHLVRNGLLLAAAGTGLLLGGAGLAGTAPPLLLVTAVAAAVAALVLTRLDEIVDLFAPAT
jgi:uncharacterized membrane protein YphA (DoxX/SURF4 family)